MTICIKMPNIGANNRSITRLNRINKGSTPNVAQLIQGITLRRGKSFDIAMHFTLEYS